MNSNYGKICELDFPWIFLELIECRLNLKVVQIQTIVQNLFPNQL
jgi:hypothetical protein